MSVQTSYNFYTDKGVAGGLYDLSHHTVDTFRNGEEDGVLKFGMGVFTKDGDERCVVLPNHENSLDFAGVSVNGFTTEMDMNGALALRKGATVGVLTHGRVWVRVKEGVEPKFGSELYIYTTGDDAGCFDCIGGDGKIDVKGRFIGPKVGNLAPVELF